MKIDRAGVSRGFRPMQILLACSKQKGQISGMETLVTRFVTYPEDGLWVAHSLELDIIGVGENPKGAIEELRSNIEAHLSFAKFKKISPFRDAPESVMKLWKEASLAGVGMTPKPKTVAKKAANRGKADFMQWSKDDLSKLARRKFDLQCA